jgi:adenylate cyclase
LKIKLPIIAQLFAIFFCSSVVLAIGSMYFFSIKSYEYQRNELSIKISTASVRLSRALIEPATQKNEAALKNIISAFAGTPEVVCVEVRLRQGNIEYFWPNKECVQQNKNLMVHEQPLRRGTRVLGVANVHFTDDLIKQDIETFVFFTFVGLSGVLSTLLLILFVSQRALVSSPITSIILKMKNFNAGETRFKTKPLKAAPEFERIDSEFDKLAKELNTQAQEIIQKNETLRLQNASIERDKVKLEALLANILPSNIVRKLRREGSVAPKKFTNVGILMLDFVDFTELSAKSDADVLFAELNEMFTAFDILCEKYTCERIKTIGDAYLAVANVNVNNPKQIESLAKLALDILALVEQRKATFNWECRIGLHVGDLVAGIVGKTKILFDVFGDGINTASRVEGLSIPMKVNCSNAFYEAADFQEFFESRGELEVKGKANMIMHFLKREYHISPQEEIAKIILGAENTRSLIESTIE